MFNETYNHERTLNNWIVAVTDFYDYRQKLVACIAQVMPEHESDSEDVKIVWIGQCPLSLLLELRGTMEEELRKLDQDMAQAGNAELSTISEHYKKLTVHTQVLSQLNQRALDGLYLAKSSNQ